MKLSDFVQSMKPIEIGALLVFVLYLVYPFQTPAFLSGAINTPLGLIAIFVMTLYLFFYTNPILGVVFLFVGYELLRRSSLGVNPEATLVSPTPTEEQRAAKMMAMNPPKQRTLEEEVIQTMAPAQQNFIKDSLSSFQPTYAKLDGASVY
jgi:hypothetical protein